MADSRGSILPPVAFRNWANAHNFYGDFSDLDAATLADVQTFFHTYYAPNNAVLLMLGDLDPAEAFALAKRYFEDIPPQPPRADVTEPPQTEERRGQSRKNSVRFRRSPSVTRPRAALRRIGSRRQFSIAFSMAAAPAASFAARSRKADCGGRRRQR